MNHKNLFQDPDFIKICQHWNRKMWEVREMARLQTALNKKEITENNYNLITKDISHYFNELDRAEGYR